MMKYLKEVMGTPGDPLKTKILFKSDAISDDLTCGQFFKIMEDKNKSIEEVESYIKIGPMLNSNANWPEIERIFNTIRESSKTPRDPKDGLDLT